MADIRRVHRTAKSSLNTNNEQDNYNYTSSTKFLDSNEYTSKKTSKKFDESSLAALASTRKSKKSPATSLKSSSRSIVPSPPEYSYNNNNNVNNTNKYKFDPDDLANTLVKPRSSINKNNSHSSRTKVRASFSKSPNSK